jgi:glycine/D-amino acid oxidase-like deaminating enzyme
MVNRQVAPTEADVVVIGAGAFGLSAAYHLASLGAGRVLVLDRYEPASQTSPRAAGLFKLVQADETLTRLAGLSIAIVTGFEAATGVPMPHVVSGSLLLARTTAHAQLVRDEAAASQGWGVELEMVDGEGAHRLAPYLTGIGVVAGCSVPGDIYVEEPASLLAAYRTAGERLGVEVIGRTPVTAIRVQGSRITGVVTPAGEVRTETVIDAAGAWAAAVGQLADVRVPIALVRHQLLITEPIAGVAATEPIARIVDAAVYVRPARGGLMMGGFEPDPLPFDPRDAAPDFSMDQVPLDPSVLDHFSGSIKDQVPVLSKTAVAEHRGGLFTMTADGRFLLGPAPDFDGLWLATGCNGSGFSLASGIGRVLAEWITTGQPSLDVRSLDPKRFAGAWLDEEALTAAGVWQYANYYTSRKISA